MLYLQTRKQTVCSVCICNLLYMKQLGKELILKEAYKLFAEKTYEQVTFQDLEIKTKFTRGGIVHHVKKKENLFKEVFDKYMLSDTSLLESLEKNKDITLIEFIEAIINWIKKIKLEMNELGIENYNWAHVNLTYQAKFYYPDFISKAKQWEKIEIDIWRTVIANAVEKKEIKNNIDIDLLALTFHNLYMGYSYSGIVLPDGVDIQKLEQALNFLYSLIKT